MIRSEVYAQTGDCAGATGNPAQIWFNALDSTGLRFHPASTSAARAETAYKQALGALADACYNPNSTPNWGWDSWTVSNSSASWLPDPQ